MENASRHIARRDFLRQSCGAMSSVPLLSTLLGLRMIGTAAAAGVNTPGPTDYRALVCFFFPGGIDSFNVLVPRGADASSPEYQEYSTTRGSIGLPWSDLLPINPLGDTGGRGFGLHPGLDDIQGLFDAGDLSFVANVGTLIEPVADKADYQSGLRSLPKGLFSHSDQIRQWQTSVPQDRSSIGWGGRCADVLHALNDASPVSMNISLDGTNVWQAGNAVFEYGIDGAGATARDGYHGTTGTDALRGAGVDGLLEQEYQNVFERAFASKHLSSLQAEADFNAAVATAPAFTTPVPTHSDPDVAGAIAGLAPRFAMAAKAIASHSQIGARRQTFFISWGGWDHHADVIDKQADMLPVVGRCMKYFWDLLGEIGMRDEVTTFTASDFGRTLSSNGRGSDHAWGGNQMVMGGSVTGQTIYGTYPALSLDPRDVGRGRFIPSTSTDEFFAELALWMGVAPADLDLVLPNVANFYTPSATVAPLGFLAGGP